MCRVFVITRPREGQKVVFFFLIVGYFFGDGCRGLLPKQTGPLAKGLDGRGVGSKGGLSTRVTTHSPRSRAGGVLHTRGVRGETRFG